MIAVCGRTNRPIIQICRDEAEAEATKAAMIKAGFKNVGILVKGD